MVTRLVGAAPIDFTALRRELELPAAFSPAAQRDADAAAIAVSSAGPAARADRTELPFVTIDPPSSRDLDQAVAISKTATGYRVFYAIADVMSFVPRDSPLDAETWVRGETIYLPDGKVPLHPVSLSEGAASLLPGEVRPAVLWTIDVDSSGQRRAVQVERALVRSRAKLDYGGVQADADRGALPESIALLPELGRLLIATALGRGAVNLPIPEQEVVVDGAGDARLVLRPVVAAEEWNAQISLLTGMAAAAIMLEGGIGLLRTMPAPKPDAVDRLRLAARALGVDWPAAASVGRVLATANPADPRGAAFVDQAAELLRGAGYTALGPAQPAARDVAAAPGPPASLADAYLHSAVGAPYAHVTAPLRRLADRYAAEVCLSLSAGREPVDWVRSALLRLPEVMGASGRRAGAAERAAVDLTEAVLLRDRVGDVFEVGVLDVDGPRAGSRARSGPVRPPGGVVALDDPPVRARCQGDLVLGERTRVRLVTADPARRLVAFETVVQ